MRHLRTGVQRGSVHKATFVGQVRHLFGREFFGGNSGRLVRRGSVLGLSVSIVFLAPGCSPQHSARSDAPRPVKTMVVAAGAESHVRSFPGKVEASKKVELAFQVPGLLVKLPVKEGLKVAHGDVIAQLREDEFKARLKTLQGQLDQARAGLRALQAGERPEQQRRLEAQVRAAEAKLANARSEYDRNARLVRTNAVSREDFESSKTLFRIAQEEHQAARQMLEKGTVAREEDVDEVAREQPDQHEDDHRDQEQGDQHRDAALDDERLHWD